MINMHLTYVSLLWVPAAERIGANVAYSNIQCHVHGVGYTTTCSVKERQAIIIN